MDLWRLVLDVVLLLAAALVCGGIAARLGQSAIVGYLLAGTFLAGPGSLRLVGSEAEIEAIAELGVSLLLFGLGLEFSFERLLALGGRALAAGTLQVVVTAVAGGAVGLCWGLPLRESIAVGAMISLSSTACVLRVLMERSATDSLHGRDAIAVLLVQDMAVVPLAVVAALLGGDGDAGQVAREVGRILALGIGLVAGLYAVLTFGAARVLGTTTFHRNRELTVLLAAATGLGATWAAHAVGISPALGAFAAGMCLGSTPFAVQVRADVSTLRVLLLTLFFGAAGMVADPRWIAAHWVAVLVATVLLVVGKAGIVWGILRCLGRPTRTALATGLGLAQIGEFAFVLGAIAHENGALSDETHQLVVSVTIVSLFLSPVFVSQAPRLASRAAELLARRRGPGEAAPAPSPEGGPDVVFVGFGPTGRLAAETFVGRPERVLILDLNPQVPRWAREAGFRGEIGDATQSDVLEHAHVDRAKLVVVTIPDAATALQIVRHVRRLAPEAELVVRSRYQLHTPAFREAGADEVLGDEETLGLALRDRLRQMCPPPAPNDPATA